MLEPKVRQMIVCEDVRTRKGSPAKFDVFGLMSKVIFKSFPNTLSFAVFLNLTDGRGSGQGRIVVRKAMEENPVYVGDLHPFDLGTDPLLLHPFLIRVFSCRLPGPGLFSIEFEYNGVVLESCSLRVEEST